MQQHPTPHTWLTAGRRTTIVVCIVAALFSASAAAYYMTITAPKRASPAATQTSDNDTPRPAAGAAESPHEPQPDEDTTTPSKSPVKQDPKAAQGTTQQTPRTQTSTPSSTPSTGSGIPLPTCANGQLGTPPNCTSPAPLGIAGHWNLILRDEFDTFNSNLWTPQRGPASYTYGDPYNPVYEDAFYLPGNTKVANGKLVLTLNQGATNGYPYSSGMVQNGRNFSYKYGYVEARVKVPGNVGVWPAFWTLPGPVDQYWPPEIDIFEFGLGGYSHTRPTFNYHYGTYPNNQQMYAVSYGNSNVNYTQDYHVYGMLWTSSKIQVFIDGQPGPSYANAATITNLPQYLIFNLGLQKGATVPSGTAMLIDYVRVWQ